MSRLNKKDLGTMIAARLVAEGCDCNPKVKVNLHASGDGTSFTQADVVHEKHCALLRKHGHHTSISASRRPRGTA